jgi:hypothetical protein
MNRRMWFSGIPMGLATAAIVASAVAQQHDAAPPRAPVPPRSIDLSREHRPNDVLFRLAGANDDATRLAVMDSVHATGGRVVSKKVGIDLLTLAEGADLGAVLARLNADPRVKYAQPNWIYHVDGVPNDPYFTNQWDWDQPNDADVDGPEAWDVATDASSVIVADIDTGMEYTHSDLAANVWVNPNEVAGNGIDDDGNGWIDDVHGIDTVNNDADPADDNGHGTHTAGTIGAVGDNGIGVTGACWKAQIMPLKCFDQYGSGDTANIIVCIDYAVANGAVASNNSWGGFGVDDALYDDIKAAGDAHHLFVAAAGNSAIDIEGQDWLPGGYDLDNVLCVAATDSSDNRAWFSNWGPVSVDLAAPGDTIYSTWPGNSYTYLSGTSMATPHVTGVATMLFAQSGTGDDQLVKAWIMDSVDPIPAFSGLTVTGGRLNYRAALDLMCTDQAAWSNYGVGFAGTNGIPALTSSADPVLDTTITIDVGNSLGASTTCFLLGGYAQSSVPLNGGTLLVDQLFVIQAIPLDPGGDSLDVDIPNDPTMCGLKVFGQAVEIDAGAKKGLSFSPGLELDVGI